MILEPSPLRLLIGGAYERAALTYRDAGGKTRTRPPLRVTVLGTARHCRSGQVLVVYAAAGAPPGVLRLATLIDFAEQFVPAPEAAAVLDAPPLVAGHKPEPWRTGV